MGYKIALVITGLFCLFLGSCAGISPHTPGEDPGTESGEVVVLLHGFGRSSVSMWMMRQRLEDKGFEVESLGYGSLNRSPEEILKEITREIDAICAAGQRTVHFVGHSLGGLLIRAYLSARHPDHLGRVVLIGSPSHGTPVVDLYRDTWWMKAAGETALGLGNDLTPVFSSLPDPDYELGVIAGVTKNGFMSQKIPGEDDGLVPVASTRINGMKDFAVVQSSHTMMRYDDKVADLTARFLRKGLFYSNQTK